jgi:hypothetical protein
MVARGPRYVAMAAGEITYMSSRPCLRGHLFQRETRSGRCIQCRRDAERERYPEKYKTKIKPKKSLPENKKKAAEKIASIRKSWTEDQKASYRHEAKIRSRKWRKNNPGHRNALSSKYEADKRKRTPHWADLSKIIDIYKNCPPGHHVDHIIPMRGKNVSGLHVHYNLQYLPAIENMRKNNRFEVA